MPRKGVRPVLYQILPPLLPGAVRHPQLAGNLHLRFLARLEEVGRFHFELLGGRFLLFLHGTCSPLWSSLFRVSSLHKGGPWSAPPNQSESQIFRETSMALIVILTYADLNYDRRRLCQLVHERL